MVAVLPAGPASGKKVDVAGVLTLTCQLQQQHEAPRRTKYADHMDAHLPMTCPTSESDNVLSHKLFIQFTRC